MQPKSIKFYVIKPNFAFNSCSFLEGKETWKTTWKKKTKQKQKHKQNYHNIPRECKPRINNPDADTKVKSKLTALQIRHVNKLCMFYSYNVFLGG